MDRLKNSSSSVSENSRDCASLSRIVWQAGCFWLWKGGLQVASKTTTNSLISSLFPLKFPLKDHIQMSQVLFCSCLSHEIQLTLGTIRAQWRCIINYFKGNEYLLFAWMCKSGSCRGSFPLLVATSRTEVLLYIREYVRVKEQALKVFAIHVASQLILLQEKIDSGEDKCGGWMLSLSDL